MVRVTALCFKRRLQPHGKFATSSGSVFGALRRGGQFRLRRGSPFAEKPHVNPDSRPHCHPILGQYADNKHDSTRRRHSARYEPDTKNHPSSR